MSGAGREWRRVGEAGRAAVPGDRLRSVAVTAGQRGRDPEGDEGAPPPVPVGGDLSPCTLPPGAPLLRGPFCTTLLPIVSLPPPPELPPSTPPLEPQLSSPSSPSQKAIPAGRPPPPNGLQASFGRRRQHRSSLPSALGSVARGCAAVNLWAASGGSPPRWRALRRRPHTSPSPHLSPAGLPDHGRYPGAFPRRAPLSRGRSQLLGPGGLKRSGFSQQCGKRTDRLGAGGQKGSAL